MKNKLFMLFLFLAAIAGYAYVLTHGICGIDDISIDLYFEVGIGVAIGRWPYYLLNKLIPIAQYTPFIADFITVILLMISAILWCVLLRTIVGEKVSVWSYIFVHGLLYECRHFCFLFAEWLRMVTFIYCFIIYIVLVFIYKACCYCKTSNNTDDVIDIVDHIYQFL